MTRNNDLINCMISYDDGRFNLYVDGKEDVHIRFHISFNNYICIDEIGLSDVSIFKVVLNTFIEFAVQNNCQAIIWTCKQDSWIVSYLVKYGFVVEGQDAYNVVLSYVM